MVWRFQHTGHRGGAFNMEYDERLARSLITADEPSTIRVYGWQPPAISLGWHQYFEEIDLTTCAQAGIDVVRRPTGGRAILHSDEVTYSVAMVADRVGVLGSYQKISEALVCALRSLGVDARLEKSQIHFPSFYKSSSSVACFASAARYEIRVRGRKLVGSAQRRFLRANGQQVILQHGSILLGPDHLRIVEFLKMATESRREQLRQELEEKTIDLSLALGRRIEFDEVTRAVRRGFEESWGIEFQPEPPSMDAARNDVPLVSSIEAP